MADKRKNNGGKRVGAGRPSKAEEQKLIERLSPLEDKAHEALRVALIAKEQWAVKLYFEYMYGKPNQRVDVTSDGKAFPSPTIVIPKGE